MEDEDDEEVGGVGWRSGWERGSLSGRGGGRGRGGNGRKKHNTKRKKKRLRAWRYWPVLSELVLHGSLETVLAENIWRELSIHDINSFHLKVLFLNDNWRLTISYQWLSHSKVISELISDFFIRLRLMIHAKLSWMIWRHFYVGGKANPGIGRCYLSWCCTPRTPHPQPASLSDFNSFVLFDLTGPEFDLICIR